jgi:hypothetical protein
MLRLKSLCVLAAVAALTVPAGTVFAGGCDSFRGSVSIRVGGGYFNGGYVNDCRPRYVEHCAPRVVRHCDRHVVRHVRVIRHGGYGHGHYPPRGVYCR